jgi:hypothetical protein
MHLSIRNKLPVRVSKKSLQKLRCTPSRTDQEWNSGFSHPCPARRLPHPFGFIRSFHSIPAREETCRSVVGRIVAAVA